jgi:DNA (cytosine-5)-methyltransferase 1
VLNAKNYGVPQNRERVFLVGIRDDKDNTFRWPVEERLNKRLKDVLESDVDDKYFLSENTITTMITHVEKKKLEGCGFDFKPKDYESIANSVTTKAGSRPDDNYIKVESQIRRLTPRECFRLMDFPDSFTWPVSDSQAYKQAGNSIVVNVLYNILKKLNL